MNKKYLLFIPLLLIVLAIYSKPQEPSEIHECDPVFLSDISDQFYAQFPATFETKELTIEDKREMHAQLIMGLRESIKKDPCKNAHLAHWLFSKPDLMPAMEKFLFSKVPYPAEVDLIKSIRITHETIRQNVELRNSFGEPEIDDGLLHGNLPSYLFDYKTSRVIRMANAACDVPWYKRMWLLPENGVFEEFQCHIDDFSKQGKLHLYVNLMKRYGNERAKTRQLENYEKIAGGLALVTFDKNSPFYLQEENFEMPSEAFKSEFMENLFAPKGNFYWSKKLDPSAWKTTCKTLLDEVHLNYFNNTDTLGMEERQDFIELTYLALIDRLITHFEPQIVNITCKQSMDRGPSLYTLLFAKQLLSQHQRLEDETKRLLTYLFAPPLLVHNRSSHTTRIERFIAALERMAKKDVY